MKRSFETMSLGIFLRMHLSRILPRISNGFAVLAIMAIALSLAGCKPKVRFSEPVKLGGQTITAEVLNEGYEAYTHYCYACHGTKGDGMGPSAAGMRPPPRSFIPGTFKFAGVAAGELPNDDDLIALVKNGLSGTPMLPWDISDRERNAAVQYIKTFSDRWKNETPGEAIKPDEADPWTGDKEAEGIERGKRLYHLTGIEMDPATNQPKSVFANCASCHPSYMSKAELQTLNQEVLKKDAEFREDMFLPALKESEYQAGDHKVPMLPTDFLFHVVKNGIEPVQLFRTIASGIGGTAMPQWKGSIKDADIWALAHYVRSIILKKDTAAGALLKSSLK